MFAFVTAGVLVGIASWSVSTVVIGLVLDTLVVTALWPLFVTFALLLVSSTPPLPLGAVALRAAFAVSCVLAFWAFASLSPWLALGGLVLALGTSPSAVRLLGGRRSGPAASPGGRGPSR